jgi:hypothetical protein
VYVSKKDAAHQQCENEPSLGKSGGNRGLFQIFLVDQGIPMGCDSSICSAQFTKDGKKFKRRPENGRRLLIELDETEGGRRKITDKAQKILNGFKRRDRRD